MKKLFLILYCTSRIVHGELNQEEKDFVPIEGNKGHITSNSSLKARMVNPGIKEYHRDNGPEVKETKVTNEKYPWLAQIFRKKFPQTSYPGKIPETENPGSKFYGTIEWQSSGGAIVSCYIIITCLHCVCSDPWLVDGNIGNLECQKGKNQNRKEQNEIFYSIGKTDFDRQNAIFKPDIEVLLPFYDGPMGKELDQPENSDWRYPKNWRSKGGRYCLSN